MERFNSDNGIRLVTLNNGSKRYEARFNRAGENAKSKRFKSKKDALAWKREMDLAVDQNLPLPAHTRQRSTIEVEPPPSTPKQATISMAIDAYLAFNENSPDPIPSNRVSDYLRVKSDIGEIAVSELRYEDVVNYIFLLRKTPLKRCADSQVDGESIKFYAEATVRKFYSALKSALNWYSKVYRVSLDEHLFKLEKQHTPKAWQGRRDRRLAPGEEDALYAASGRGANAYTVDDWKAIIGFALETAMREQEIVLAKWNDLFSENYKLKAREANTKSKRERVVLLSKKARGIVDAQKLQCPAGEERIFHQFPNPVAVCSAFADLVQRAKIDNLHFHDLRHEATSRLCETGKLRQMVIMEMTGHRTMTTFQGYVHLLKHESSVILD